MLSAILCLAGALGAIAAVFAIEARRENFKGDDP